MTNHARILNMQIVPAILVKTLEEFYKQINTLLPYYHYFQIDIADGIFVPNKTIQIDNIQKTIQQYNNLTIDLSFDFHLMVKDYKREIKKLVKLKNLIKIKNVFIHDQVVKSPLFFQQVRQFNLGLVLDPQDRVENTIKKYNLQNIYSVQIMSVLPGFQGSPFIKDTLIKIEQLRTLGYRNNIFIDGGINEQTIPFILEQKYLPDALCIGSYLTKAENIEAKVKYLKRVLPKASAKQSTADLLSMPTNLLD